VDTIKRLGALTQVELADATGLSTATVSIIVNELVAAGIVATTQVTRSGRRAIQVTLSRGLGLVAGIHFSTRALKVVLADPTTVVASQRLPLPAEHRHDTGMDRAAELIAEMLASIGAPQSELLGAGLGICSPYNPSTDMLAVPGLLRGWDEVRIAESMSRRLGKPVAVDNDANLGMLGESRYGAARNAQSGVFVSIGHGIGAGILYNGEIMRGHDGTAGEIGHVRVVENGALCHCGNRGCLEVMVNSSAIVSSLRNAVGNVTLRDVIAMARQGDLGCSRVISDAAHYVGTALASVCNLVNPEIVIIGGELADAGPILIAPLEASLERNSLHNPLHPPRVEVSDLGEDASVLGAAAFAFDSVAIPVGGTLEALA
jgi:predicted NBD/HSP70 family sugar kinase